MADTSGIEEWARRCIELELGEPVVLHDDGSRDRMFDLEIRFRDGRRAAVEVTAAADPATIELWNLVNGEGRWIEPTIAGGWMVTLKPSASAKRLKSTLPTLLQQLESGQVVRLGKRAPESQWDAVLARLGITSLSQSGTDYPGSIYFTVDRGHERTGGMAPVVGNGLADWAERWLHRPDQQHNIDKVRVPSVDESHVFLIVPGFSAASFEVDYMLMVDDAPLPEYGPQLPDAISHLWVMSTWRSGEGMRWSAEAGWRRFDKQAAMSGSASDALGTIAP